MSEYVFYKLKAPAAQEINPQDVPYPVRTDHINDIFGGQKVAVDKLLQDLDSFVREHPELRPHYADTLGRLAYVVGVDADGNSDHAGALRYFEMGLAAVPDNLTLRAGYGLTLHKLGRESKALAQYEQIFADPDRPVMPWVWLLAVRVYAQRGQYARAHALLEECAPLFPEDANLQRFAQEMQSKAVAATGTGDQPIMGTGDQPVAPVRDQPVAPTCPQCSGPITPGAKFCRHVRRANATRGGQAARAARGRGNLPTLRPAADAGHQILRQLRRQDDLMREEANGYDRNDKVA